MEVKLKVLVGKSAGQELVVQAPRFLIGRHAECNLRPRSDQIAERHCAIDQAPGLVTITDLGSQSGTFVNGQRISDKHELRPSDQLKIGPLEFEVLMSTGLAAKKSKKVANSGEAASRLAAGPRKPLDFSELLNAPEPAVDDQPRSNRMTEEEMIAMGLTPTPNDGDRPKPSGKVADPNAGDNTIRKAEEMLRKYRNS